MEEEIRNEYENNDDEDFTFTMTEEIREHYDKVKHLISEEEFLSRMGEVKKRESSNPYMNVSLCADSVV